MRCSFWGEFMSRRHGLNYRLISSQQLSVWTSWPSDYQKEHPTVTVGNSPLSFSCHREGFSHPHIQMDPMGANSSGLEKIDLPVLTQPGLGMTTTTMTTITQTGGDWSSGLLDVCDDSSTCFMGAFAPCCLDLSLAHHYGECMCLPLLPGSTFAIRVGIRERFKIRGSVCEDWTTVYCCYPLALCQMIREMKTRLKTQIYTVSTALESS